MLLACDFLVYEIMMHLQDLDVLECGGDVTRLLFLRSVSTTDITKLVHVNTTCIRMLSVWFMRLLLLNWALFAVEDTISHTHNYCNWCMV